MHLVSYCWSTWRWSIKAVCSFYTSGTADITTQCHIPEDQNLHLYCCENRRTCKCKLNGKQHVNRMQEWPARVVVLVIVTYREMGENAEEDIKISLKLLNTGTNWGGRRRRKFNAVAIQKALLFLFYVSQIRVLQPSFRRVPGVSFLRGKEAGAWGWPLTI